MVRELSKMPKLEIGYSRPEEINPALQEWVKRSSDCPNTLVLDISTAETEVELLDYTVIPNKTYRMNWYNGHGKTTTLNAIKRLVINKFSDDPTVIGFTDTTLMIFTSFAEKLSRQKPSEFSDSSTYKETFLRLGLQDSVGMIKTDELIKNVIILLNTLEFLIGAKVDTRHVLWVLDEPLTALHPVTRKAFIKLMLAVKEHYNKYNHKLTIIYSDFYKDIEDEVLIEEKDMVETPKEEVLDYSTIIKILGLGG